MGLLLAHVYSAEIVNSLTNLTFMYLAYRGISNCIRNGHDRIFLIAFVGYLVVGTGSFLFHSTLKYPMQLIDELSMIYTTCLMFFATFGHDKSPAYQTRLGIFLVGLALFITLYYHYLQDPTFHQNMYTLLTAIVLGRCIYVMETQIRPSFQAKQRAIDAKEGNGSLARRNSTEQGRLDRRDANILGRMWLMILYGLSMFLGGFTLWTMDNQYCSQLVSWRRRVGLPWGLLAEGHGWWHLMTGIGAYFYIVWGIWLRQCLNGKHDEYEMVWPRLITSFPEVNKRDDGTKKGQ